MEINREELIKRALEARQNAYCPYSHYMVGAALLGEDGKIYTGCNVENGSYGLTICAERCAMFKMVSEGCKKFLAIAVATGDDGTDGVPCMACRQVMCELCAHPDVPIYDCDPSGRVFDHTLREMAPYGFLNITENNDYHG